MRDIPPRATHQFDTFTFSQALAAGWTLNDLKYAVRTGRLIRLRRGVYCLPIDDGLHEREQAAILLGRRGVAAALTIPDAAVSNSAALATHRLPLYHPPELPCITKPQGCRTLQADLHLHRKLLLPRFLDRGSDFAVTSIARSCIDVACEQGLLAGVIAADAALHDERVTWDELLLARMSIKGDVGSPTAGRLLDVVDGRSESPLESLSRINMTGLVPPPLIQPRIFTLDGVFIGRCDFGWENPGVIGEADGLDKYLRHPETIENEKKRQGRLSDTNAVIARWGWDVAQNPNRLGAYLHDRFEEAWQRKAAGVQLKWIIRQS